MSMTELGTPARLREPPLQLLKQAMGDRATRRDKLRKLAGALWNYGHEEQVIRRLERLRELGCIVSLPWRTERMICGLVMLRFLFVP